jgi:maleate cis-trans isomerase
MTSPGPRKRIGVMIPSTNTTCQADFQMTVPRNVTEARTGKPAVSSNQSTIWTALRALGITRPITGFGRLLEHLTPAGPAPAAR